MKTGKNRHHFFINCDFHNFLYICLWFDFNIFKNGTIKPKFTN